MHVDVTSPELWSTAWCIPSVAEAQMNLSRRELKQWLSGNPHAAFDPFKLLLKNVEFSSMLDIGCGCGYYSEVLKAFKPDAQYTGVDCSQAMVELANVNYPGEFLCADSVSLPFADSSFDVVCMAGLIGHVHEYWRTIDEAKRVTRKYILLHRIGCFECDSDVHRMWIKRAYGVLMAERYFHEGVLLQEIGGSIVAGPIRWNHSERGWMMSVLLEVK